MRIGSELRDSAQVDEVRSPYDGSVVGEVCVAGAGDMQDAIAAATEAFETTRRLPTHKRISILEGTAERLAQRAEEIAKLMARESGKPIRYCRGEVKRAQVTFALGAAEASHFGGEVMPIDLEARGEGRLCLFERVPRGPVAAISPFNFPLNLIAHKLSPAVAVGASTVLKPPPQCPLTGHLLGDILADAGLPDGALNVLHCPPDVAQIMVEDDRLKVLSFTGSDVVGWKLKNLAGRKQVLLELGGNAPCVIDEGVDLEPILAEVLAGSWANAGQVCIKVQRILVHSSLYEKFLARFVEETRKVACGDPLNDDTVIGPLIEAQHARRVREWIDEAVAGGATLHCGGEIDGQVVTPAVLTDTTADMRVCKDEVFGPVTVIEPFDRFEDAIATCNASRFGLQAGIFTPGIERALYAYRNLEYGGVMINAVPTFRVDNFPYGGSKDSGFGREGVRFAMEEMTEPRVMVMRGMPRAPIA
jgi:glyceraldehyde-3-phosphate dehydrogenase (NADP+)